MIALWLLLAGNAMAQAVGDARPKALTAPMSIEFKAPESKIVIGAPIELEGLAQFPQRFELSLPADQLAVGSFTVTGVRVDPPRIEGGMKIQALHLRVVPFDLGSQNFPSLSWSLLNGPNDAQTLRSPPVRLQVEGPDPKSGGLRDIHEPLQPPLWAVVGLLGVVVLTLALIGYEAWRLLRSKDGPGPRAQAPRKPAHEEALEALEALAGLAAPDREAYERCAEILRLYLERRFAIPALVLTSSDLVKMMREAEIDRPIVGLTRDLFSRCDLVKFAKLVPEQRDFRQDIAAAIGIVRATASQPQDSQTPSAS